MIPRPMFIFFFYATTFLLFLVSLVVVLLALLVTLTLSSKLPGETALWVPGPGCGSSCVVTDEECDLLPSCYITVSVRTISGPTGVMIVMGVLGVLGSVCIGVMFWSAGRCEGSSDQTYKLVNVRFLPVAFLTILALASLLYTTISESKQPSFNLSSHRSRDSPFNGPFTRERWVCGLRSISEVEEGSGGVGVGLEWTEPACLMARTARWGVAGLFICLVVLGGFSILRWKRPGVRDRGKGVVVVA
ncbi:hypothetical protein CC78DRAFT_585246 [Lojkania enalia]|uniref:Transmembrane protein n=1 Tax=Lojkania enalia TaxID=147567 RepID=A0A9P4K224_9PLEO|nr:hypothetical protein CC78DRAFT_585246 [Didymosphaeria enalia]